MSAIKSAATAYPVYASYTTLKKEGNGWAGRCPFSGHRDSNPSFTLTDRGGTLLYNCFGGCGGGDVIAFVMKMDSCSFQEAVAKMQERSATWKDGANKVNQVFQQTIPSERKEYQTFKITDLALAERSLADSPLALSWLKSRAISLETAKKHHLGFVQSVAKVSPEHEFVNGGWILMPTLVGDAVTCLKYRSVIAKSFVRKTNMETSLYNSDSISPLDDIFLVEGEIDAWTLTQAGYSAVALPGAQFNVTPEAKDRLLSANRIFLAGDTDSVGQATMQKLWTELRDRTYLLKWPEAKDANELLNKLGGDTEKFRLSVEKLKQIALEQPMPFMHDLTESLAQSTDVSPFDNPARLRFPWPRMDAWAVIVPGDLVVVSSSETGMGKSSFVMDILLENAIKYGKIVVNYSGELPPMQYARRAAAFLTGVPKDSLGKKDFEMAALKMGEAKFYNGYKPFANYKEVVELLKWAKRRLGADIMVVDPLHFLIRSEKDQTRAEAEASKMLKDLAIEFNLIMVNVVHPRKPKDEHFGRELQTRGLKGSGSIGDDASQVFILHRKRISDSEGDDVAVFSPETKVILDKSRESEGRTTKLLFRGEICKFVEMFGQESYD